MRKFLTAFCVAFLLFLSQSPVLAQTQDTTHISLYSLQTEDFPTIRVGLDVTDAMGSTISGLQQEEISLLEDGQPRALASLEQVQVGVQFALALDPGPTFAYRDADAVTRLDKIVQAIKNWADNHSDTLGDDLSLIPTYGTQSTHLKTTSAFLDALAAYQPDLQAISPSMNTLAHALDAVSGQAPQAGMKSSVLLVTSPVSVDEIPTLQNLTERAVAQNVHVDVWIVSSTDFFATSGATALKDLAIQTGGQYMLYSGTEPLPDPGIYLAPLRSTYRLTYDSGIRTAGSHTLTVQAILDGETITSAAYPFDLNLQPPNPILVSPPEQIVRQAPDERTTDPVAFIPTQQTIEILVEFPDGRKRPLVSTALLVDGQKVAENDAEPFDHFTWDVSSYVTSSQYILSVEAVDSLGLSKVSLGIPVTVTIIKPQFGLLPFLSRNSLWVALIAIIFAGAVLGIILAGGRIRRRSPAEDRGSQIDPLTQPVEGVTGRRTIRMPWKRQARESDAYLLRLKDDGQPMTAPPIPISPPEMTFGSDPLQVTRILDDPSVSPLHARIREENGGYFLSDEKSTAGTWVNHELLASPRRLQHADVLQIGRFSYRFMLRKPPERPAPKIDYNES